MCGIAGVYFTKKDHGYSNFTITRFVDTLFKGIEPRGRHATGLVSVGFKGQGIHLEKRDIPASEFIKLRDPIPEGARAILLHTRWATQGDPEKNENNHPVKYRGVYVTHNGVINNDDTLFESEKLKRFAEVDSEIIAALLWQSGLNPEKAAAALEKLQGGYAVAALKPGTHPDQLLLARGGTYPLVVHQNEAFIVWASTATAIEDAFKAVFTRDGKPLSKVKNFRLPTEIIPSGTLWVVKGNKIEKKDFKHQSYVRRSSSSSNRWQGDYGDDFGWADHGAWDARPYAVHGVFEEAVKALRDAGKGKATVMPPYNERTQEQRDNSEYCTPCRTSSRKDEFKLVNGWGRICPDCVEQVEAKNKKFTELDPEIQSDLDDYLLLEPDIQTDTLREVAKRSGYPVETVEYIIFRLPKRLVWRDKKLEALQKELRSVWQSIYEEEWDDALWNGEKLEPVYTPHVRDQRKREAQEAEEQRAAEEQAHDQGKLFIACAEHGTVEILNRARLADGCPECIKTTQRATKDTLFGEMTRADGRVDLPCSEGPCIYIGRILRFGKFWVCSKHDDENIAFYQLHDKMPEKHLSKVAALAVGVMATNEKEAAAQNKAPDEPEVPNPRPANVARSTIIDASSCYIPNCPEAPVAVMPSGYFACHNHARGVKGAKFINKKRGVRGGAAILH